MYKGSQGYGFVAFSDPLEGIKAMKEMNGRLCGNRPMKVMKSEWQKKDVKIISFRFRFWFILNCTLRNRRRKRNGLRKQLQKHILPIISYSLVHVLLFVPNRKGKCSGFYGNSQREMAQTHSVVFLF